MLQIHDLFLNITDAVTIEVALLSNFADRNIDWKNFKHEQYNNFLKALDCSGRVREIIKLHHSTQQRKTQATKMQGDHWQNNPKIHEFLRDFSGTEQWLHSTVITIETSTDSKLVKRCLNFTYVNCIMWLKGKLKANKGYTSGNFQESKQFNNGYRQLEEGIHYEVSGLKWY